MTLGRVLGMMTVSVAVTACAAVDRQTASHDVPGCETVVVPMQSEADRVAGFYDRIFTLKADELAGELDLTRQSFETEKSDISRLQLALLLSLPGASFRDENTAIALLHPFTRDKGRENSTLRPLAIWLHSELVELRRTEENLQQQAARFKEEQKRSEDILQQQAAKLKDEQHRSEALQQKLEAILDMEMKLIEREQNLPKKK
jgi:hypothetical protein